MRRSHIKNNEQGYVMAMFGIMLLPLMGVSGFSIDLGNWYLQAQRLQHAADAAALSGSVHLPNDFPAAKVAATSSLVENNVDPATMVISQSAAHPTELTVSVSRVVPNYVLEVFGMDSLKITRQAIGEYRPFVPMGSPSNVLGKEPVDPWETSGVNNHYWLNIAGGTSYKSNGDRWSGGACNSIADRCSTAAAAPFGNSDYSPDGQIYVVRVNPGVSGPLRIQAFDPEFAVVNDQCDSTNLNGAPTTSDNRYAKGNTSPYCTGDQMLGTSSVPTDTTYELWTPADSAGGSKPISTSTCKSQTFAGYNGVISTKLASDAAFAASFRQWVTLCDLYVGSTWKPGDYLLHVSTPQTKGGMNRFSLRAGIMSSNGTVDSVASQNVSVFSRGRLVIYALEQAANVDFYLARIHSGAAGHTMTVTLFDIGDAAQPVSLRITPPPDATVGGSQLSSFAGCTYTKPGNTYYSPTTTNCGINNMTSATYDGKIVNISIPIPADYTCDDADPNACWTHIAVNYSSGSVSDTTSWEVGLDGNPVHLVTAS